MTKKGITTILCAAVFTMLGGTILSFAGEWKPDAKGWRYDKGDTYAASEWIKDGEKWYYINADGYMLSNTWVGNYYLGTDGAMLVNTTTPDGYQVGADGAWLPDSQPQTSANQYLDAYATFLRSYKIPKGSSPRFQLLYLDHDAIPELLISENSGSMVQGQLYHYYQGQVQALGSFGENGGISYIPSANIFYSSSLSTGIYYAIYHKIQDNTCIPLIRFDSYSAGNYYEINGSPVTKEEFNGQEATWKANYPMTNSADYDNSYELNETNINRMMENIQNVMPGNNP